MNIRYISATLLLSVLATSLYFASEYLDNKNLVYQSALEYSQNPDVSVSKIKPENLYSDLRSEKISKEQQELMIGDKKWKDYVEFFGFEPEKVALQERLNADFLNGKKAMTFSGFGDMFSGVGKLLEVDGALSESEYEERLENLRELVQSADQKITEIESLLLNDDAIPISGREEYLSLANYRLSSLIEIRDRVLSVYPDLTFVKD